MKLDIGIEYSDDPLEYVAEVSTLGCKCSGLVGWGSIEDNAVRDLQGTRHDL